MAVGDSEGYPFGLFRQLAWNSSTHFTNTSAESQMRRDAASQEGSPRDVHIGRRDGESYAAKQRAFRFSNVAGIASADAVPASYSFGFDGAERGPR